jgi:hypothetical protein
LNRAVKKAARKKPIQMILSTIGEKVSNGSAILVPERHACLVLQGCIENNN